MSVPAGDRYDLQITGGASNVTLDTPQGLRDPLPYPSPQGGGRLLDGRAGSVDAAIDVDHLLVAGQGHGGGRHPQGDGDGGEEGEERGRRQRFGWLERGPSRKSIQHQDEGTDHR